MILELDYMQSCCTLCFFGTLTGGILIGEQRCVLVGMLSPSRQYKPRCQQSGEESNQETADEGWVSTVRGSALSVPASSPPSVSTPNRPFLQSADEGN